MTKSKLKDDSEIQPSINENSQIDNQPVVEEPWPTDQSYSRVERLQSSEELNSVERKRRRNDTLFIGKFLSNIEIKSK